MTWTIQDTFLSTAYKFSQTHTRLSPHTHSQDPHISLSTEAPHCRRSYPLQLHFQVYDSRQVTGKAVVLCPQPPTIQIPNTSLVWKL